MRTNGDRKIPIRLRPTSVATMRRIKKIYGLKHDDTHENIGKSGFHISNGIAKRIPKSAEITLIATIGRIKNKRTLALENIV